MCGRDYASILDTKQSQCVIDTTFLEWMHVIGIWWMNEISTIRNDNKITLVRNEDRKSSHFLQKAW